MKIPTQTNKDIKKLVEEELQSRGWTTNGNEGYRLRQLKELTDIHANKPRNATDIFVNIDRNYQNQKTATNHLSKAQKLYNAHKENRERRSFYFNAQQKHENGREYVDLQWKPRDTLYHE